MLADEQIERYSRQIILPQVGGKGQEKLLQARVLVNGTGPLQNVALLYLAAVGIGTCGVLIDAASATTGSLPALQQINPDCTVVYHDGHITEERQKPSQLVHSYDLVLSSPDPTLHEACYVTRRPLLCAQVTAGSCWFLTCRGYDAHQPCLHCIPTLPVAEGPPTMWSDLAATFLGTVLATAAIMQILGLNQTRGSKLFQCQFPAFHIQERVVEKNPLCDFCRGSRSETVRA
jgi:adenylyltransferase/sulfurtransferase